MCCLVLLRVPNPQPCKEKIFIGGDFSNITNVRPNEMLWIRVKPLSKSTFSALGW